MRYSLTWLLVLGWGIAVFSAQAADFRIDTQVFVDESVEPAYETVTLFQRGIVYDFLGESRQEVTIYDPGVKRFILLDATRKMKTEISEDVLLQFVAEVKIRAPRRDGLIAHEAANPNFRSTFDAGENRLSLNGRRIDYVATGGSARFPNGNAKRDYFNFIDMYTRLNATRVGAMPPQARLELNKAMAEHDLFPASIERTLRSGNPLLGKVKKARSTHTIAWRLVRSDQDLIDKSAKQRAAFKDVSFGVFRSLDGAAE